MKPTTCSPPYRFEDASRAIEIAEPDLPAPWINYLSNGTLHAFLSQCEVTAVADETPAFLLDFRPIEDDLVPAGALSAVHQASVTRILPEQ